MAKDVVVVVQRDSLHSEKESLDLLLISTAGAYPVGVYRDIESVERITVQTGFALMLRLFVRQRRCLIKVRQRLPKHWLIR